MTDALACEHWPALLEPCVERTQHFHRIIVLRETGSTQDAALQLGAKPGDIVTAFRQTAGRGRLGRAWADTESHGIAVTFIIAPAPSERLAIQSAVAAARAAASLLTSLVTPPIVGIKWPNDIVVHSRKLAGILVEQDSRMARIGVGMNISQTSFPAEIAARACSLLQLGVAIDRSAAIVELITHMDQVISEPDDTLASEYQARNVLVGCVATFKHGERAVTGRVLEVDTSFGVRLHTADGECTLPAFTTSLLQIESMPGA